MKKTPTFVLALSISASLATFSGNLLAQEIGGQSTAISVDAGQFDQNALFGKVVAQVTTEKQGLQSLISFLAPEEKLIVVRNITSYDKVRNAAIANGVTTAPRVMGTKVFAIEDALASVGMHMRVETYALARGIKIANTGSSMQDEVALLNQVYNDLLPRINSGELPFVGPMPTELS